MEIATNPWRSHPNYKVEKADAERAIGNVPEFVLSSFKKFDKDLIKKHTIRYAKKKALVF